MINVLITSFGSNTSIGVAKCLKDTCFIVGTDSNPYYECNGYAFADEIELLPYYNDPLYKDVLLSLIEKYKIDCIIPIHDKEIEVISKLNDAGIIKNVKIAANPFDVNELCNDKALINSCLVDFIQVPIMYQDVNSIKNFPVIVKDNDGVSSKNIFIAYSKEELVDIDISNKIIQQYIKGEEYTVDCFTSYINQEVFYYSVRKRIETKSGMSVKSEIIDHPLIGGYCKKIHQFLQYKGVSNIQFIVQDNIPYFIEINPRFAGAGILTYKSGYNFPLFAIQELCNSIVTPKASLQIGNKMVRYYEETFFDGANLSIRL
ncbi:ATP-grasp domain-containing protein [Elizabethkingia miricola]|uniref:ATP-grasp domain-containing protein n=1 Tax=Elizabethkingia miricola TaxID=172045 RepID=A0ABD5BBI6_ELIMR|nr:ATP-grasp domain-containing protein [Elizabethkingia miricola]MDQ8750867.1 ATP-grasp domain-containing protein [Elizabethkingia miricola]NHQ68232.1 ATP-grasp domain-containing protein [Elizabethkingia miricola]NHQ72570.1 ATP-grasp domain-containing protein [Elizabethkingia miricola]NHQ79185.1 ATP-grasp domain-containing protein [Elizabethkingia miricola]OPB86758.1 hypothetical protein BAS06_16375 [Elizabethkingia miricola]